MTECILTLGSNCPAKEEMMAAATRWLASHFPAAASSGIYRTRALNGVAPDYLNMVVKVRTALEAERLIQLGKEFEAECGRSAESKRRGIVEMDVDLVKYGKTILRPEEFTRTYFLTGYNKL